MFSQMSVCPQGGVCPIACWDTPPWAGTPPGKVPPGQTLPPGQVQPPAQCMLGYTPPPAHSACWDTVNKQAVCIPLECILVRDFIPFHQNTGEKLYVRHE